MTTPNARILNREFQHPSDGWYMIEPKGDHPVRSRGLVQVIDDESTAAIVNRFNADADAGTLSHGAEMLIDHEHFKHDTDKETRAYGWLGKLQNRADGIYGQIRWSGTGKKAVDEGDYRFFSTEYDPADLKVLNDAKTPRRMRPMRLDGLTLTNNPNNKGCRPITNRAENFPVAGAPADSSVNQNAVNKTQTMKSVCSLLGLSPEADETSVSAAVSKLLNRADITPAALQTLQAEHQALGSQVKTLQGEQADSLLAQYGITEPKVLNRMRPMLLPLATRDERVTFLTDLGFQPVAAKPAGKEQTKLFNREGKAPTGAEAGGGNDAAAKANADKIMNRAQELRKQAPGLSLATAIRQAQREHGE